MIEGTPSPARAPAVVAVVVTTDPGSWFEETLRALAAQDYESLSVLVVVAGGTCDPTELVASVLPDAFVGHLDGACGFGAAVNHAMTMIEGAPFLLLCHDDCAPAVGAVRLMVEESFRSNAAVVSPKVVRWEDERALLHVGQGVDKTGAVVERVQDGEVDAGQHDAVRDVFVAPGGCTLVRTDLLRAVGGYDAAAGVAGDDLDLSWRAHVAGARIVVAPAAVVRHLELVSSGRREPPQTDAPSLDALHRRHEVAAMLVCYTWPHLLRVLPQAVVLGIGELVVAVARRDRPRVVAIAHAWRWNLTHLSELRRRRAQLAATRTLPDADIRRLQVRGSARLSRFVSHAIHRVPHAPPGEAHAGEEVETPAPARFGATARARLVIWIVAAAVLVFGSRSLIGTHWPTVGQLAPFPEWTSLWHHFVSPVQGAGIASSSPPSPAFAALGVLGTLLVGRMGLLQHVVVLGCVPLGAWGISRLMRPFGSVRARLSATLAYLALPLGLDALSRGRWDGLVAYAALPWVVGALARASGLSPFDHLNRTSRPRWRRTLLGRSVALGVLEAVAVSVAPAVALDVLCVGAGIALGSLLSGGWRGGARAALGAGTSTLVAAILCAPWLAGTVRAGWGALAVLGLPGARDSAPGWSGLLRLAVGPIGTSPLSWLLLAVAVVPLVLASGTRFTWVVRLWSIAVVSWLVALVATKAWAVPFAPSLDVVLAPAAVGIAGAVGLAVASFERDLAGHRFGWRQGAAVLSVAAILVGFLPVIAGAGEGAWSLPASGYAGTVAHTTVTHTTGSAPGGSAPVLWLGAPQALPVGGWTIEPGLAYGLSNGSTPGLTDVWVPATPGRAGVIARDVRAALLGRTVRLGASLARLGVHTVAVAGGLWTATPGTPANAPFPLPADLLPALQRQVDLETVPTNASGMTELAVTGVAGSQASPQPSRGMAHLLDPLAAALAILGWVVVAAALVGRRRWLDWWLVPLGARRRKRRSLQPVEAVS